MNATAPGDRLRPLDFAVACLAAIACVAVFAREPGLGDDINYWARGFRLIQTGSIEIGNGFHDLRWPIWGVCWLLQLVFGHGLVSYYGEPALYLALGTCLVLFLAHHLTGSRRIAWTAGIAFLFQPLLDPAIVRPMPDLSEGFFCAAAFTAWLLSMESQRPARTTLFAALGGLALAMGYANRITGALIVPVISLLTLVVFPRRFHALLLLGAFTILFIGVECAVYHHLLGDWLHSLHANLGARGRKGTESLQLWQLPFRFFDSLWTGNFLKVPYQLLAFLGIALAARSASRATRAAAWWPVLYFFVFSCMLQSASPPRPLVRDGDRFVASLGYPLSIMTALAVTWLARYLHARWPHLVQPALRRPRLAALAAALVLALVSSRDFIQLGFVPPLRAYLASLPAGTRIFTHARLEEIAYLVDARRAATFRWQLVSNMVEPHKDQPAPPPDADQWWFNRKMIWTDRRKDLEREEITEQRPPFDPLIHPSPGWHLARVLTKDGMPDFAFFRIPRPDDSSRVLRADDPALQPLLPAVRPPLVAEPPPSNRRLITQPQTIPEAFRGRRIHVHLRTSANTVEAAWYTITFLREGRTVSTVNLRPYFYPSEASDFFCLEIPAQADAWRLKVSFNRAARRVTIHDWTVTVFEP
jgi:hypothetical protein